MPPSTKWFAATPPPNSTGADILPRELFSNEPFANSLTHHRPEAILSHPDYSKARALLVSGMTDLYGHDPVLNRLLVEAENLGILSFVMSLWGGYSPQERTSWPTVKRLKAQLARFGLASSRHVDDVLARLVATDYIVLQRIADDRRVRLLEPTERMVAHVHGTILPFFCALDLLFGDARPVRFLDQYERCQMVRGTATTAIFPWAARLLPRNNALSAFFDRTCAIQILFQCIALGATSSERPVRETCLAEFGARLGMSRTHVRNILRDAEEAGLTVRSRQDGVFHHLTPTCVAGFDRFVADAMSLGALSCGLATTA